MTKVVEILKKTRQSEKINKKLPLVIVKGRSTITKLSTIKVLNDIISNMGSLNDFTSTKKQGLKFYIETSSHNILSIIKRMQESDCLQPKKITSEEIGLNDNILKLNLLIALQVNRHGPYLQKKIKTTELEIHFHNQS